MSCQPRNCEKYFTLYLSNYNCVVYKSSLDTFLEWKWVRESVFDIKFNQKCVFEKMAKNHFFGKKMTFKLKKIILC